MKSISVAVFAAVTVFVQGQAQAQTSMFDITFSNFSEGGTTIGNGSVSASLISPGVYEAFSGSFTFTSSDGLDSGVYSLLPNPNPPNQSSSPSFILFDNQVSPGTDPFVDNNGLLFESGSIEINLFSPAGNASEYELYENTGASVIGDATITIVPEPSALMLVLPFGAALCFLRLKRAT